MIYQKKIIEIKSNFYSLFYKLIQSYLLFYFSNNYYKKENYYLFNHNNLVGLVVDKLKDKQEQGRKEQAEHK